MKIHDITNVFSYLYNMCLDKRYTEIWIMMNLPVPCPHYPHYLPVQIFTRSEKKIFARSYCGLWRGLNILLMLLEGTRNLIRYINKTYIALEEDHLLIVLSRFASNSLFTTLASCLPTLASRWTRPVGSVK